MTPTDPRDHAGWLAHWSDQLVRTIRDAVAHPECEFRLAYAVNCARIAHSRACKAYPRLKEPK